MPSSCICMHSFCIRVCSLQCEMRLSLCNPTDIFFRTSSFSGQLGTRKLQKKRKICLWKGIRHFLGNNNLLEEPSYFNFILLIHLGNNIKVYGLFQRLKRLGKRIPSFHTVGALSKWPFGRCLPSPKALLRMLKSTSNYMAKIDFHSG